MVKKVLLYGFIGLVALFVLIQLVPFGRNHTNPPVLQEPNWDSPQTRALAKRACFDCHSNETVWPWYSNIAPISWLVANDTYEGRSKLNFSEWGSQSGEEAREAGEAVMEGEMPPLKYFPTHPDARLTDAEKLALAQGLDASLR